MEQDNNKYVDGLVSIIMPAYNAEKNICEAIDSVLAQTYTNWELIVVNDCSTDTTLKVLNNKYSNDARIKIYSLEQNSGVANARNFGFTKAKGRYLAFLDSDDLWYENKLEVQMSHLACSEEYFIASSYDTMNDNSERLDKMFVACGRVSYLSQLKGSQIGCLTVVIDRDKTGDFYFENLGHEDYILWQKLFKTFGSGVIIPQILGTYRIGGNSLSSNKLKMIRWQYLIYRNKCKLGIIKSLYYLCHYAFNGLTKYQKKTGDESIDINRK